MYDEEEEYEVCEDCGHTFYEEDAVTFIFPEILPMGAYGRLLCPKCFAPFTILIDEDE